MDDLYVKRILLALESLGSVVLTDEKGRYLYASPQRLENGGFQWEQLKGRYVHDIYPDTLVDDVLRTGKPITFHPMQANTPNGQKQSFVSYYPLIDNGICIGCFLYTSFFGMNAALEFTHLVDDLTTQLAQTKKELQTLKNMPAHYSTTDIIGQSPAINQLKLQISMVARTSSNVLIQGETGTGKELVAQSIHNLSIRRTNPFIRVNCSAIPENLMESEFFGYEDGAFTGAKKGGKPGKFEKASGGSLFLDEVNSLPLNMQPKFLRVLQEKEVERIGGTNLKSIDTRIISATNTPLEELVRQGIFRQDLFYRLNVVNIHIPPLRERREDIPLLVNMFISQLNVQLGLNIQGISGSAIDILMDYNWPGNIRELQNMVEQAMNYAYEGVLLPSHFHLPATHSTPTISVSSMPSPQFYKSTPQDELQQIQAAIKYCNGNKKAAAKLLGIARSTLYEKLKNLS